MHQDLQDLSNKQQNLLKLKKASEAVQNNSFVKFVTLVLLFFIYIKHTSIYNTVYFGFFLITNNFGAILKDYRIICFQQKQIFRFFAWYELSKDKANQEYYIFFFDVTEYIQNDRLSNYEIEQLGFMKNFIFNNQIPLIVVTILCIIYWILSFVDVFQLSSVFQKQKQENQADSDSQNLSQTSLSNGKLSNQQYQNQYITDFKDTLNE
ncbi:hypothetical protein ABPG72_016741 [Tetrahymena utriculariae]